MTTLTSTGAVNLTASTNWSPAQIPVAGDDLIIAAHTLTLDADMVLNSITFNNASSRLAISGTSRSVGATNGFTVSGTIAVPLITSAIPSGTSVTLTGQWVNSGSNGGAYCIATSTGGNLTLQTVGASQSSVLFAPTSDRSSCITTSWTGGTLTTIGLFNHGTGTQVIVTMSGGTWVHQSSGVNNFGSGAHRIVVISGTATLTWTGSITSYSNIASNGLFTLGSNSTTHTIGAPGDVIALLNGSTGQFTYMISQTAGTLEIFGDWYHVDGNVIVYQAAGTFRYRNQSVSIPASRSMVFMPYGGSTDLSGLVVTNAGKFIAFAYYQVAVFTTSAGTSITCTSTSAFAVAHGTTSFNGKIVTLESDPPTLPSVEDVASGTVYGYTGITLTGTGIINDPAAIAAAMLTSFASLPEVLVKTTIATLTSQTVFTLTAGSADNDVYNSLTAIITDQSTSIQKAVLAVSDYVGSTKTLTLSAAPGFTIATGDLITIIAGASSGGSSFPAEAPADWLKPAGIQDGAFTAAKFAASSLNGKGDWLTTLGANAPADWFNAASISADAGAELAALVEAYIVNEGDATAVMQAIADRIAADWVAGDASPLAVAAAVWANATRTITGGSLTTAPPTAQQVWEYATRTITGGSLTTSPPTAAQVADAVWDEARVDHATAGTFGEKVNAELDSASVNAVADQVWDEATSGHTTAGTYGGRIVRATNSNTEVQITGSNHIAADVHEFQAGVITAGDFAANSITASALATDAVTEIQSGLASQLSVDTLTSYVDTEIAAIKAKTDNLPSDPADQSLVEAAITAATSPLATPAQVNAQVLDVLSVDTFAELSAPPAATSSLKDKLTWLFMWVRNKGTATATQRKLYADDGTTLVSTETITDDGTTFTKGEAS